MRIRVLRVPGQRCAKSSFRRIGRASTADELPEPRPYCQTGRQFGFSSDRAQPWVSMWLFKSRSVFRRTPRAVISKAQSLLRSVESCRDALCFASKAKTSSAANDTNPAKRNRPGQDTYSRAVGIFSDPPQRSKKAFGRALIIDRQATRPYAGLLIPSRTSYPTESIRHDTVGQLLYFARNVTCWAVISCAALGAQQPCSCW